MDESETEKTGAPLIGLTTYHRNGDHKFDLPAEYVDAVRSAGGIPVLVPPGESRWGDVLERLDAIVLTGGGDISPDTYGGTDHPKLYMVDAERDSSELALARHVVDGGIPMLGICRGIQVLNVALGGTLVEHLPDVVGDEVPHRTPPRDPIQHGVSVEPHSRLAKAVGQLHFECASWHHQSLKDLAPGLEVVARAPDDTIEAVELVSHPWLVAVQWHPELTAAEDPIQQRLFEADRGRKETSMKIRRLVPLVLVAVSACGVPTREAPAEGTGVEGATSASPAVSVQTVADVESAIRQFYVYVNTFDHAGIRQTTSSDFEFMDGGRRMDGDAFEAFMRGIESGGITLGFELSELNTEVAGEVAYTSYLATTASSVYTEAGVLRRSGDGWIVDRVISAGVVPE